MRALHLSDGTVELRDVDVPEPGFDESLIKVTLAGICDTDLHLKGGYMDFTGIPGHEFVGVVEKSDREEMVGLKVVGEINAGCNQCEWCRDGLSRHCPNRTVLGILNHPGAHAPYVVLPTRNLHLVPKSMSDEVAVFTEPVAAACEILEQMDIDEHQKIAVVGDGKLGLLIAQVLALEGAEVHAVGRHEKKLEILSRRGIATECIQPGDDSSLPDGWANVVVECTGNVDGFATAQRLVRPRGTFVLKSTYAGTPPIYLAGLVIDEITLLGSRCGPFAPALKILEQEQIDTGSLLADRFPLSQGVEAYERAAERGVLKVLLEVL